MYHKLIQQLAARASIIETFRKKRDSSSNTRREKRIVLLPIYSSSSSSRPSHNCDKSVVSQLLRIRIRVSFDNMRSVPLAKINIYNVYSSGIFKYNNFLSFGRQTTTHLSLSFYINLKRKACALSLSFSHILRAHLIILYKAYRYIY